MDCSSCAKFKDGKCAIFEDRPNPCWAWTNDPNWDTRVESAVEEYEKTRVCAYCQLWEAESEYVGRCAYNSQIMYCRAPACERFRRIVG